MRLALPRLAAVAVLFALVLPLRTAQAAEGDVERALTFVELRIGGEQSSLTAEYLREVATAFKDENSGDYILLATKTTADKIRKSRDQIPGTLTDERRTALAEAKKEGIRYLDNADAANAIKALSAVESKYRAALAAPGADEALRKEYLDVLAQLATAYVVAKDNAAAEDTFRTVITTFGFKAPITDDNYRPDVVELFQKVVKATEKMSKGTLEVASTPAGARVILGGNDRAATPATIPDLIPGNYAMRLQAGSVSSMLHLVKIQGGGVTKVVVDVPYESHLVVEDDHVGLGYADLKTAEQRLGSDAVTLGKELEVNVLCVVGVADGKLVAWLVDVNQGRIERSAQNKVPSAGVSKRAITKVVNLILGEKGGPVEPTVTATPWYTSVPGWGTAGGALVSLGVGAAFASYLDLSGVKAYYCEDASKPCTNPDPVKFKTNVDDFKSSAETKAVVSGAGLGLGAALAVTSGVLFYLHGKSAPTESALQLPPSGDGPALLPPVSLGWGRVSYRGL